MRGLTIVLDRKLRVVADLALLHRGKLRVAVLDKVVRLGRLGHGCMMLLSADVLRCHIDSYCLLLLLLLLKVLID